MDITSTTMIGPKVTRQHADVHWVYAQGKLLTGPRWCYLSLGGHETMISSFVGNPAGDNFEILESFRPATEHEMFFLGLLIDRVGVDPA